MEKIIRLVALVALLLAGPSWSAEFGGTSNALPSGAVQSFTIKNTLAVDDYSKPINVCGTMRVTFFRSSTAVVSMYAVEPDDDTLAEFEAANRVAILSSDTTIFVSQSGAAAFRLVVDTAETSSTPSHVTIQCGSDLVSAESRQEACAAGAQGGNYDSNTGRFQWTCADFNWPGWRNPSQATASYTIDCTGEGAPHASCYSADDTVYKGYWMRMALAAQYTSDGGQVIALPHPYNYDGAGLLQDGVTRAQLPQPYDPEWEDKPGFAQLGYPTYLMSVVVNRGVTIEGAGVPGIDVYDGSNATVTYDTPRLKGSFLLDDYGPTMTTATAVLDGPNQNMSRPSMYATIAGWNKNVVYCHTTSNTNPACNREVHNLNDQFKLPGADEYGYMSPIIADFTISTTATLCVNDAVTGAAPDTATGLCRENRSVTCWNAGAASGRNVGGCIFDTDSDGDFTAGDSGNLNLGVCESFHDSLQYDRQTRQEDLQLVVALPNCADDATSSTMCQSIVNPGPVTVVMGYSSHIYDISTPIGSWAGPAAQNGNPCGVNGALIEVGYKGGVAGSYSFGAERQRYYFNTGVVPGMQVRVAKRDKLDLKQAGFRNFGFMPSSWYGRTSAGLGTCTSAGDIDAADDEAACDNETQFGFTFGYNGLMTKNLFLRASHNANKSGVIETEAFSGGPNYVRENVIYDTLRINGVSDWGDGVFERNVINGVNLAGTGYPLFACYSDNCIIKDNWIERVKASYVYGINAGTTNNIITGNRYRDVSYSYGGAFYDIKDSLYTLIEGEDLQGVWGNSAPILRVTPGHGLYHKPTVIFRNNRGLAYVYGYSNAVPTALTYVENGVLDTTRADSFKAIQIIGNHFRADPTSLSNSCFLWLESDSAGDAAAQVQEKWGNILVRDNVYDAPGTPDVVCMGTYRTSGVVNTAANDTGPSAQNTWPIVLNNILNNIQALDVPHGWRAVANVPDADDLAEGTKVKVSDGTAGCGHAAGVLTAGAVRISCTAHPNGAGNDGTWTAD